MGNVPVVVVGAGLAGYTLIKELRKLAPDLPITLVTADSGDVYAKPMLSNALAQGHSPQGLVQIDARAQADQLNIRLIPHCRVRAIHRAAKHLDTDTGPLPYGRLVLATGGLARRPDCPGASAVQSVNHLEDYTRFRSRLLPGAHVCILGAGLVGCEFANDLIASGHRVTVIEAGPQPLARLLPAALASRLIDILAAQGVTWRLASSVVHMNETSDGFLAELSSGERITADLFLSAIGLVPETGLARDAGLGVGRGIVVNALLTTDDPDIHALGDCAEVCGLTLPYVLPLMHQARTLAATLTGAPTPLCLPAIPVVVKTPACPLVACPPTGDAAGHWFKDRHDATGAVYHYLGTSGELRGFALAGDACGNRRQLAARVPALLDAGCQRPG